MNLIFIIIFAILFFIFLVIWQDEIKEKAEKKANILNLGNLGKGMEKKEVLLLWE